jgi:hypothetical protein
MTATPRGHPFCALSCCRERDNAKLFIICSGRIVSDVSEFKLTHASSSKTRHLPGMGARMDLTSSQPGLLFLACQLSTQMSTVLVRVMFVK